MKPKFWRAIGFLVWALVAVSPTVSASSGTDVLVVSASMNGDASYMVRQDDGNISDQTVLQLSMEARVNGYPFTGYSYGNGLGDFDNDGDLDYIMAIGRLQGHIFIFENKGPDIPFEGPVPAGTWSGGWYPGDMAVADFNNDGNFDFVMTHIFSPNLGLYLGDGAFGFEYTLLENTAGSSSIGIDAADFNGDGNADFVVAPNSTDPIYVYLGDGQGAFKTLTVHRQTGGNIGYGIAAADFTGDGIVDLATSGPDSLAIYKGSLEIYNSSGEGTIELFASHVIAMSYSPLDNGDFNGDGKQDLVAANFGGYPGGVAVLSGDGHGNFTHSDSDTYLGEIASKRTAVSAWPYLSNKPPVAIVAPEIVTVTVGETVEWDASQSFDDDGNIVGYDWDFGEGTVDAIPLLSQYDSGVTKDSGEATSSYVYYDSGTFFVTLTVTDDQGATGAVQAEVQVVPLSVKVYFSPHRLNLKSRNKWVNATIWVPDGYDAGLIDPDSLHLIPEGGPAIKAYSDYRHRFYTKYKKKEYRSKRQLTAKFDRQALINELAGTTGTVTLTVSGAISSNGTDIAFAGAGTIKTYTKKKKISSFKKYFMQQIMRLFTKYDSKSYRYSRH